MKKILFVGSEALPFASTGGLGDVLGSLPSAICENSDFDVRVIMPLYSAISSQWREKMKEETTFYLSLAWRRLYCGIYSLKLKNVTYYFVDNEYYFNRYSLYGEYDDGERFAFFSMAVMEAIEKLSFYPDVLHAHDWQGALSIIYLNHIYKAKKEYQGIKTVFTIHNIEYQGKYDFAILGDVFSLSQRDAHLVEHDGVINLMKGAIEDSNRVTTVSPTYALEIQTPNFSHGLHGSLKNNSHKLSGILNGIDYNYYDPKKDREISANYSSQNIQNKGVCKVNFQRDTGLYENESTPLLSVISRLVSHKGIDLIEGGIVSLLENTDAQFVVLGKGEERYENFFKDLENRFPKRVRAFITYDRELSKKIYSASDIFLMPSHSEPCGLAQMIASRYGAIPVVRETGGLYDSIKPYYKEKNTIFGNGFTFAGYSAEELFERTRAAIGLYLDKNLRKTFVRKIMRTDFSWKKSAKDYISLYEHL
ncbi:MAG: glycogen synthase [Ruminococcaceae bacterium]|nr:glycogen synthase [Oscillospiraceae bacterium]